MSLQSDHKALIFLATVATLGTGVRIVRAAGREAPHAAQPALDHQMQAADSSARAGRGGKAKKKSPARTAADTGKRKTVRDSSLAHQSRGPLDRPGWIGGKLDLDVATAAQLDSLPGVTPAMAKRIIADRMTRGPFLNKEGLRRVPGAGPRFIANIDSLVTFSGTFSRPAVTDTVIGRPKSVRARKSSPRPP